MEQSKKKYAKKKEELPMNGLNIPPNDSELEEVVLGALMIEPKSIVGVIDLLNEQTFYKGQHQIVWSAILNLFKRSENIDILTVSNEVKSMGNSDTVTPYFIASLTNRVASAHNIEIHSRILAQLKLKRDIALVGGNAVQKSYDETIDSFELLDLLQTEVNNVAGGFIRGREKQFKDVFKKFMDNLEKLAFSDGSISGVPTTINALNHFTGGWQKSDLIIVAGRPGCISGDTLHYIARDGIRGEGKWYTTEQLYNRFNGISKRNHSGCFKWDKSIKRLISCYKNDQQLTGLNEITDIVKSGIKKLYCVTTITGKKIKTTLDHRFLTKTDGNEESYLKLSELKVGMSVICKANNKKSVGKRKIKRRPELLTKLPYYPNLMNKTVNGCTYQRVSLHRLFYDAGINGITTDELIHIVKTNENHTLKFSSKENDIHHIDGNFLNNDFSNLLELTKKEHGAIHGNRSLFGRNFVQEEEIISIEYHGEEMTYDICCKSPYNNFLGNGFVVHNSGKTAFTKACVRGVIEIMNESVLIFSLEMTAVQLVERFIAEDVLVNSREFKNSSFTRHTDIFNRINEIAGKYDGKLIIDDTAGLTVNELKARAKRIYSDKPFKVIIVDYLQLLAGGSETKGKSTADMVGHISKNLKQLAKDLDVPVIALSQLNRLVEQRPDKRPILSDLRDSGSIEQDSDIVCFLYRPEYYNIETLEDGSSSKGFAEFIIGKNRSGAIGTVKMKFTDYLTRFTDWGDYSHQESAPTADKPLGNLSPNNDFDGGVPF